MQTFAESRIVCRSVVGPGSESETERASTLTEPRFKTRAQRRREKQKRKRARLHAAKVCVSWAVGRGLKSATCTMFSCVWKAVVGGGFEKNVFHVENPLGMVHIGQKNKLEFMY